MTPTHGSIEIDGTVAGLLELGAGFNPEFTGRENALLNLKLMGGDRQIEDRMPWVEEFAGIGDFIDRPVRTYSSGMFVRLAFAVVASIDPDVLLVDEALTVGDAFFQEKCYAFMRSRMGRTARLVVSHDLAAVSAICDRVCVLSEGRIVYDGDTAGGVEEHLRRSHGTTRKSTDAIVRSGPRAIDIESVDVLVNGKPDRRVQAGDDIDIVMCLSSDRHQSTQCIVGMNWSDRFGQWLIADNTVSVGADECVIQPGRSKVRMTHTWPSLKSGEYMLTLGVGELPNGPGSPQVLQCWAHKAVTLHCTAPLLQEGILASDLAFHFPRSIREAAE